MEDSTTEKIKPLRLPKEYRTSKNTPPPTLPKVARDEIVQATITNPDWINLLCERSAADKKIHSALRMLTELDTAERVLIRKGYTDKITIIDKKRKAIAQKTYQPAMREFARLNDSFWKHVEETFPQLVPRMRLHLRQEKSGEYLLVTKLSLFSSLRFRLRHLVATVLKKCLGLV